MEGGRLPPFWFERFLVQLRQIETCAFSLSTDKLPLIPIRNRGNISMKMSSDHTGTSSFAQANGALEQDFRSSLLKDFLHGKTESKPERSEWFLFRWT